MARVFEHELKVFGTNSSAFQGITKDLRPKLEFTINVLAKNDFKPIIPDGGYFIIADWTNYG